MKAEQQVRGMESQEKEEEKDEEDIRKLFRKFPQRRGVY